MKCTRACWIHTGKLGVQVCLLALFACGRGEDTRSLEDQELAAEFPEHGARAAAPLSDAEIAHVMVTAIVSGSQLADLARTRSANPAVARFAEVVVADHAAMNVEAERLRIQLRLTPAEQQHSRELQEATTAARMSLDTLNGPVFDRTYILREIEYHRSVLELFETTVIPAVQTPDLRSLLENIRPAFAAHLQRAEQIRLTLGS